MCGSDRPTHVRNLIRCRAISLAHRRWIGILGGSTKIATKSTNKCYSIVPREIRVIRGRVGLENRRKVRIIALFSTTLCLRWFPGECRGRTKETDIEVKEGHA